MCRKPEPGRFSTHEMMCRNAQNKMFPTKSSLNKKRGSSFVLFPFSPSVSKAMLNFPMLPHMQILQLSLNFPSQAGSLLEAGRV